MMKRFVLATLTVIALATVVPTANALTNPTDEIPPTTPLSERFREAREGRLNKLNERFREAREGRLNKLSPDFERERQETLDR